MLGWFIFVFDQSGFGYLKAMFTGAGAGLFNRETIYLFYNYGVLLIALILGSTMLPGKLAGKLLERLEEHDWVCILLRGIFYVAIFLLSVAYLVDASYNPFLYFRF